MPGISVWKRRPKVFGERGGDFACAGATRGYELKAVGRLFVPYCRWGEEIQAGGDSRGISSEPTRESENRVVLALRKLRPKI